MGAALYEGAKYHNARSQHGTAPTDEKFGVDDKRTPECREVISLVGLMDTFDEGADVIAERLAGLR